MRSVVTAVCEAGREPLSRLPRVALLSMLHGKPGFTFSCICASRSLAFPTNVAPPLRQAVAAGSLRSHGPSSPRPDSALKGTWPSFLAQMNRSQTLVPQSSVECEAASWQGPIARLILVEGLALAVGPASGGPPNIRNVSWNDFLGLSTLCCSFFWTMAATAA